MVPAAGTTARSAKKSSRADREPARTETYGAHPGGRSGGIVGLVQVDGLEQLEGLQAFGAQFPTDATGFHTAERPEGELWQASGYCYAYYKCSVRPGIDAFILHRHVDHGAEGGLKLGLWTRDESSPSLSQPLRQKMIYEVFRQADTPDWEKAFAFALPVIGITNWHQLDPPP